MAQISDRDVTIDVKFYDDNGRELGKAHELVKANGKKILKPTDFVKTQATGVAFISATGGKVTGEYWQAEKDKISAEAKIKEIEAKYAPEAALAAR